MTNPVLHILLAQRGEIPVVPTFPPLPAQMKYIPYGLDEHGKHIKDIRGNVIKYVILTMLETVAQQAALGQAAQAKEKATQSLLSELNQRVVDKRYAVTLDYLLNEGNLYSYEFSAFVHYLCNQLANDPYYFFNIGQKGIPIESVKFLFRAVSIKQVYVTMASIGSKFSAEQFTSLDAQDNSIVIQRRTPATLAQLGETPWLVHLASGCHTLRGALSTFPTVHSDLPYAEIEERQCLLRGDECCEWKFFWQQSTRKKLFGLF